MIHDLIVPDAVHRCQNIIIDSDPHVKFSIYVIASRPRNDRQQAAYQGQVNWQTVRPPPMEDRFWKTLTDDR
jgi:hypothetical protein